MANTSIFNAFERMWQHVVAALNNKSDKFYVDEAISSIPAWAKAASKPTYTAAEVGAVTEAQVTTMINNALGVIENGAY